MPEWYAQRKLAVIKEKLDALDDASCTISKAAGILGEHNEPGLKNTARNLEFEIDRCYQELDEKRYGLERLQKAEEVVT